MRHRSQSASTTRPLLVQLNPSKVTYLDARSSRFPSATSASPRCAARMTIGRSAVPTLLMIPSV